MGSGPFPAGTSPAEAPKLRFSDRLKRIFFGKPRDVSDTRVFHRLSVVAFLAWVGLGADGLSSSAYGPEEAFRTLGEHRYLAVALALLMILTVFIISACYSRIIERFPHGGGGYVVATALLGEKAGVVSGAALLVDYVLTITVSIAAAGDALFSFLPMSWQDAKLLTEIVLILMLTVINIRGVKESIMALMPVFILFLITHAVLIVAGFVLHADELPGTAREVSTGFSDGLTTLGAAGMLLLFVHAYSLGGGTYTGIEAVSNGLPIMREPRVATARRTMIYMAVSLAATAAGLLVCYLLWDVQPQEGKTLNAVLTEQISAQLSLGHPFVVTTLVAEGALLVVAAQAGFIDGPRVLSNMATDSWMPRRFAILSDRLTTQNGIVLMGLAALAALVYTAGDVRTIVVMYSINVFLTFSLSMLGMAIDLARFRAERGAWKRKLTLFVIGFSFCATILGITIFEKFREGGWVTLAVTGSLVLACFWIRSHYDRLNAKLAKLFESLSNVPATGGSAPGPIDSQKPIAAVLVGGYSGLGIHTALAALRAFPGHFKGVVFLSVGVIDSGIFKGEETLHALRERTEAGLNKYVELMRSQGIPSESRLGIGADIVDELEKLCIQVAREFPAVTYFAGQLVFREERWVQRLLHNRTAFDLQKRLQLAGKTMVILPARI